MSIHSGCLPGCIGRVTEMHASYCARTARFGAPFEGKVATELAAFCLRFWLGRDGLWLALDFCRARGQRSVHLWTFDGLHAARHLYEKHGFVLARTQRGAQWGKEVNEQLFTLDGA